MQWSQTIWSTKEKCVSPLHCAKALKQYGTHNQLITYIFDATILKQLTRVKLAIMNLTRHIMRLR
jgi:hypothetical protein